MRNQLCSRLFVAFFVCLFVSLSILVTRCINDSWYFHLRTSVIVEARYTAPYLSKASQDRFSITSATDREMNECGHRVTFEWV
jgi:hypothetical protein